MESIVDMDLPINRKELHRFIWMVSYYRDMMDIRSHNLQEWTKLTSVSVEFQWISVEQEAFDEIKQIAGKVTLLLYPNFNICFDIHTYTSKHKLGAVIIQEGKPI